MSVDAYLRRLGRRKPVEPRLEALTDLHRRHLLRVPFENIDIPLGRPIVLRRDRLFEKIVERRRGGFCYELNGLFAWLLGELGFEVAMLSGRVFSDGKPGPEFDHMALRVETERGPHLADVGFGDSFVEPLPLEAGAERRQRDRTYRLDEVDGGWTLMRRLPDADWEPQYVFTLQSRALEDYAPMCRYQQTSPDSVFTRKSVCSRLTREGRVTLSNGRLIETAPGRRSETVVGSVREYRELLDRHFGIRLDDHEDADLAVLLRPARPAT